MDRSAGVKTILKESPCMDKGSVMLMVVVSVIMSMTTYAPETYMLQDK
jgi:hypothetical protein